MIASVWCKVPADAHGRFVAMMSDLCVTIAHTEPVAGAHVVWMKLNSPRFPVRWNEKVVTVREVPPPPGCHGPQHEVAPGVAYVRFGPGGGDEPAV